MERSCSRTLWRRISTKSNVPSFRKRGFRLFDRDEARGLLKCRAVFRAESTLARVRFLPSRGLWQVGVSFLRRF